MEKIYINLSGGIGNIFFQLAMYDLLKRNKSIDVSVSYCEQDNVKKSEIDYTVAKFEQLLDYQIGPPKIVFRPIKRRMHRLLMVGMQIIFPQFKSLWVVGFQDFPRNLKAAIYDGYWQREVTKNFLSWENLRPNILPVSQPDKCAIHLRLGDYTAFVNQIIFRKIGFDFYTQCVEIMIGKGIKNFSIFHNGSESQGRNFCKTLSERFNIAEFSLAEPMDSTTDHERLGSFKYLIGGNSTFCLSAWLCDVQLKEFAIFPKHWTYFGLEMSSIPRALTVDR